MTLKLTPVGQGGSHVTMAAVYQLHGGVTAAMTVVITLTRETAISRVDQGSLHVIMAVVYHSH